MLSDTVLARIDIYVVSTGIYLTVIRLIYPTLIISNF